MVTSPAPTHRTVRKVSIRRRQGIDNGLQAFIRRASITVMDFSVWRCWWPITSSTGGAECCDMQSRAPSGTTSRQSCGSFTGCRFANASRSSWQSWFLKSWMALRRRICQTTASSSAPPAAVSCGLPASKHACYNVPLHI